MPLPNDKPFEIELTWARPRMRRFLALAALAVAISGAILAMSYLSVRSVVLVVLIAMLGIFAVLAMMSRQRVAAQTDQLEEELSERKRIFNLAQCQTLTHISIGFAVVSAAGLVVTVLIPSAFFFAPFVTLALIGTLLGWRVRRAQIRIEHIDDPSERLAARSELVARVHGVMFWLSLAAFITWLSLIVAENVFGVRLPVPVSFVIEPSMIIMLLFLMGCAPITAGLIGRWVPSSAHCGFCRFPYNEIIKPARCPKCYRVLTPEHVARWRRARPPRLVVLGAVILVVSIPAFAVSVFPSVGAAMIPHTPTRVLIAQMAKNHFSMQRDAVWAEIQLRMPLTPTDRERLLDSGMRLIRGRSYLISYSSGFEEWLAGALVQSPDFDQRLNAMIPRLSSGLALPDTTDLTAMTIGTVIFAMDPAVLPVAVRSRIIDLGLDIAETYPVAAETIGANAWLLRVATAESLTNEELTRFNTLLERKKKVADPSS